MARPDDFRRIASDVPNAQRLQNLMHFKSAKAKTTSPTFQQLLQLEDSNLSQKQKKNHDQEDDGNHHNKKSVLAKVKDKAKKLKYSLSVKKHRDGNESRAPSSSVGREEEAKYRTPSQLATEARSKNQTPPDTFVVAGDTDAKHHVLAATTDVLNKAQDSPESGSRFSGPTISTQESGASKTGKSVEEEMKTWDKGVSVKEYLMHKFEPGEDERALSQVITQTISPRRDKMKEAMSSFLKNDEPSKSTSKVSNSEASSSIVANDMNQNLNTNTGSKNVSFSPSHSLGKSKASSNLNQIFKSTVASYQNHNLGSSPNHNTSLNSLSSSSGQNTNTGLNRSSTCVHSPAKPSLSPLGLGHGSGANETRAPVHTNSDATQVSKSSPKQTRVPLSNRTRVPVSGNIREVIEENRGRILRAN